MKTICQHCLTTAVQQWYDIIREATIADAVMDRLIHDANQIDIEEESFRKSKKVEHLKLFEIEG